MAQSQRIGWRSSAPTTDFNLGADIVAQSLQGNYSVVRISVQAINRGNTGSYDNGQGFHRAQIDGVGDQTHYGTLPSGYGTGAVRWDEWRDLGVGHDWNGYLNGVTLRQIVSGWFGNEQTAWLSGFARIPKRPDPPGTPVASEILPTSMRLSWSGTPDDRGSGVYGYLLRRWDNPDGSGGYIDSFENNTSRVVPNLTPGKEYRFAVYARNSSDDGSSGYSNVSGAVVARTLSGMWTKYQSAWRRAAPFVKVAGVWRAVSVFIKSDGTWHRGG
jgi:hypothetical protein